MTWTATSQDGLGGVLQEFKDRFNNNPRAKKLVNGWNRWVVLDSMNTPSKYALIVQDQALVEVRTLAAVDPAASDMVHLQADEAVLKEIFSGKYNPATALTDGALSVFSSDRDKVKLEALAMIIWRLG